jgi:hypothetical protein
VIERASASITRKVQLDFQASKSMVFRREEIFLPIQMKYAHKMTKQLGFELLHEFDW